MQTPWLKFEFTDNTGGTSTAQNALVFTQPQQIIVALCVADVLPALQAVQQAVAGGAYAAGYVSYEAAPAFDPAMRVFNVDIPNTDVSEINNSVSIDPAGSPVAVSPDDFPLLWFGIFDSPISAPAQMELPISEDIACVSDWQPLTSQETYYQDIAAIREAIARGETYQVNYTLRLQAQLTGEDYAYYRRLVRAQQPGYAAYLNLGRYRMLAASPELFFHRKGDHITTRPMKGTTPRGRWQDEDQRQREELASSLKNRAENVMIVDLLRNDLGRLAIPGSVQVTRLFDIERYPTVWQMTSTVEARLPPTQETTLTELFTALFPCGSITGAPKINTMRHIAALETTPRRVYCGAIGYITPKNEAVFNVAIRTLLLDTQTGTAVYGVGGGITWDSDAEEEYAEALMKAKILNVDTPEFELFESLRLENGRYWLLDRHLERLQASADYFGFPLSLPDVRAKLNSIAEEEANESIGNSTNKDINKDVNESIAASRLENRDNTRETVWKVRCLVSAEGEVRTERQVVEMDGKFPLPVALAEIPVSRDERFLYHKTTHRIVYETRLAEALAARGGLYDVLLWNEQGELTEFTRGNLVANIKGRLLTPALESGLLAGTLRSELLAHGDIQEKVITCADLAHASGMWLINSVRGWLPVRLVDNPYATRRI